MTRTDVPEGARLAASPLAELAHLAVSLARLEDEVRELRVADRDVQMRVTASELLGLPQPNNYETGGRASGPPPTRQGGGQWNKKPRH